MTLQIDLTPELEARLREEATAAGKDVATFARDALEETLTLRGDTGARPGRLTDEQRVAEWLAWTSSARPLGYIVDDSRESIYEGCGE
jgi:hypothetical protein